MPKGCFSNITAVFPGGSKSGNPTMTTSTVMARRKGDPQYFDEGKIKIYVYLGSQGRRGIYSSGSSGGSGASAGPARGAPDRPGATPAKPAGAPLLPLLWYLIHSCSLPSLYIALYLILYVHYIKKRFLYHAFEKKVLRHNMFWAPCVKASVIECTIQKSHAF